DPESVVVSGVFHRSPKHKASPTKASGMHGSSPPLSPSPTRAAASKQAHATYVSEQSPNTTRSRANSAVQGAVIVHTPLQLVGTGDNGPLSPSNRARLAVRAKTPSTEEAPYIKTAPTASQPAGNTPLSPRPRTPSMLPRPRTTAGNRPVTPSRSNISMI